MAPPAVVFTDVDELDPGPGRDRLEAAGFEVRIAGTRDARVIADVAHDAAALVVGYATVDGALLDRLPDLRIISTMSAGTDMVDLAAAERRGLWVTNLPDAATEDVAVHALAATLSLVRRLPDADAVVRSGGWGVEFAARGPAPRRASELTLGLVGFGRIARRLARLAAPVFGAVTAYDPHADDGAWPPEVVRAQCPEDLVARADVVSLHVPLTDRTRGLVDTALLAHARPGSYLVNVSRGELIETGALLEALDTGRLRGAALDVLPVEPPPADDPLRTHAALLLSPHSAYLTDASRRDYVCKPADNIIAWRDRGTPLTPVVTPSAALGRS